MNKKSKQAITLIDILRGLNISQAELSRGAGLSKAAVSRLVTKGLWPARDEKKARENVVCFLLKQGATPVQARFFKNKAALETATNSSKAIPNQFSNQSLESSMLLEYTPIAQATLKHFGLSRSPFTDDVQSLDDVFVSKDIRYVRACLEDIARNHGFGAFVGESGAGKSILAESLEEKLKGNSDIVIIKPYVLAMEKDDVKGKTLKSGQICESIARALDPDVKLKHSPQARFKQVHDMLKDSRKAGRRHLLLIEEAHCLPIATLKHLKRFQELKDGLQRLIGIALIGQPELATRLSSQNPEVREVMQRCEIVYLPPLNNDLQAYLAHKLERAGARFESVFSKDAVDAIRTRLVHLPRGGKAKDSVSLCYPLVVNNLVSRAMNEAAASAFDKVTAEVIAEC